MFSSYILYTIISATTTTTTTITTTATNSSIELFVNYSFLLLTFAGPLGLNWIRDLHIIHMHGELGIVFFLFEMGLELSLERLKAMKKVEVIPFKTYCSTNIMVLVIETVAVGCSSTESSNLY